MVGYFNIGEITKIKSSVHVFSQIGPSNLPSPFSALNVAHRGVFCTPTLDIARHKMSEKLSFGQIELSFDEIMN